MFSGRGLSVGQIHPRDCLAIQTSLLAVEEAVHLAVGKQSTWLWGSSPLGCGEAVHLAVGKQSTWLWGSSPLGCGEAVHLAVGNQLSFSLYKKLKGILMCACMCNSANST